MDTRIELHVPFASIISVTLLVLLLNCTAPLIRAAQTGQVEIARKALKDGADVNQKFLNGATALHIAANNGQVEIVRFLLDNGAAVNARTGPNSINEQGNDNTPLHEALSNVVINKIDYQKKITEGHIKTSILLLERGADVNAQNQLGWSALHFAARTAGAFPGIIKTLIDKGANVNQPGPWGGYSPLHIAASWTNPEVLKNMLAGGANIAALGPENNTPLHTCYATPDNFHFLVSQGADIRKLNKQGFTAYDLTAWQVDVWKAARKNNTELVKEYLSKGGSINRVDLKGWTALHWAAYSGSLEVVRVLVENKANVNAEFMGRLHKVKFLYNNAADSDSPLSFAKRMGHQKIVEYLKQHGGR